MMSMNTREELEEERRLFYVAITRAEENLMITCANMRYKFGSLIYCQESRFLDEVGDENIEVTGQKADKSNKEARLPFEEPTVTYDRSDKKNWRGGKPTAKRVVKPASLPPPKNLRRMKDVAREAPTAGGDQQHIEIGTTVEHQKFDKGKVLNLEGMGKNRIATILFEKYGQKKIILKFAKLQVIT